MVKVIGVRFRTAGKIYYFDPLNFQVKRGDHVIVETARGVEYGTVVGSPREVEDDKVVQPLKPVLRVATERDDEQEAGNKAKEKEAFKICQEKIRKHGLEMKLVDVEYTFDGNKVLASGDTLFCGSVGRTDFKGGSMSDLVRSVKEKLFVLPNDTAVLPGHEARTTIGYEKQYNMYLA